MTPKITPAYLDKLEALEKEATPGPWKPFDNGPWGGMGNGLAIGNNVDYWPVFSRFTDDIGYNNSKFCAEAREAIPELIKALRIAVEGLESVKNQIPMKTARRDWPDTNESRMYKAAHEALKQIGWKS